MERNRDSRLRLLYVKDYMDAHRGAARAATMAQVLCMLGAKGIAADRRNIYEDLKLLEAYGMLIRRSGNRRYRRYYTE